jgi:hypothetical protein
MLTNANMPTSSLKHLNESSSTQMKSMLSSDRKLKTWHLAILLGIPSATMVTYFMYKYLTQNKIRGKNVNEKNLPKIPTNIKSTFTNPAPASSQPKTPVAKTVCFNHK